MYDKAQEETFEYTVKAAEEAEELRSVSSEKEIVFSVGTELTGLMQGIVEGSNVMERFGSPGFRENMKAGKYVKPLNDYLARVARAVRSVFNARSLTHPYRGSSRSIGAILIMYA
ncbi:MAG TPA: hypothetical protein VFF30_15400 [Nitrososphaerales archaeon]|nr:hypothetical protein [Nitrososphaerales archaeon]